MWRAQRAKASPSAARTAPGGFPTTCGDRLVVVRTNKVVLGETPRLSVPVQQLIVSTLSEMPRNWLAVCAIAILLVILACSIHFGGSRMITVGDLALVIVLELAAPLLLRSPLDFAHLRGYSLAQWSAALGTAVAILAIVAHHRLQQD